MATKKIKRFQEGGVSDKDRGLKASKDEKVGFFERLRMGNIDEEGSEAYRRFGAGRGKLERTPFEDKKATPTVKKPAPASEPEGVIVTPIPDAPLQFKGDAMEEANARAPIAVPAGPRADMRPDAGMPKQRVVSKKELEASGLSLRDFLNRERGLTRKGMSKAEAEKQLGLGKPVSKQEVDDAKKQLGLGSSPARAPGGDAKRRGADTTSTLARTPARTPGGNSKRGGPTSEEEANIMATGGKVKAKTYAKGGMTRGDGICIKGKTKGKFV